MNLDMYSINLVALASLLSYFGLTLLFGKIPNKLKGSVYEISQKLMGSAFTLISLSIIVFFFLGIRDYGDDCRAAYNLNSYFIISTIISASFTTLIGTKTTYTKSTCKKVASVWLLYSAMLWIPIAFGNRDVIKVLST